MGHNTIPCDDSVSLSNTMKISVVTWLSVVGYCVGEWLKTDLVFCTLSEEEFRKCQDLATATMTDQLEDDKTFGSYFRRIQCTVPYPSPEDEERVLLQHVLLGTTFCRSYLPRCCSENNCSSSRPKKFQVLSWEGVCQGL